VKRIFLRIFLIGLAFFVIAILIGFLDIAFLKPWHAISLSEETPFYQYSGATHIHTRHSDGSGFLPEILEAARKNDLDFLVVTDHNTLALKDSIAQITKPVVLVGAELSLGDGHLLADGLPALPENFSEAKLGGLEAILDSVDAHHGFAIIAHPFHPKIRWRSDTLAHKIDGVEILNADVEWRNDNMFELLAAFLAYPFFDHAMNYLLDLPEAELKYWNRQLLKRRVAGIGSVDAHARIKLGGGRFWKFPSYKKTFSLVQNVILLRDSLSSPAQIASRQIAKAIREGNSLFGFASLGRLEGVKIWCENDSVFYLPGETIPFESPNSVIKIRLPDAFHFESRLYLDGNLIASSRETRVDWPIENKGVYRVAVFQRRIQFPYISRKLIPWVFSNPFCDLREIVNQKSVIEYRQKIVDNF
jgi:hypothetical protein